MNRKNVIDASERVDVPFPYINDVDTLPQFQDVSRSRSNLNMFNTTLVSCNKNNRERRGAAVYLWDDRGAIANEEIPQRKGCVRIQQRKRACLSGWNKTPEQKYLHKYFYI